MVLAPVSCRVMLLLTTPTAKSCADDPITRHSSCAERSAAETMSEELWQEPDETGAEVDKATGESAKRGDRERSGEMVMLLTDASGFADAEMYSVLVCGAESELMS
eukprot:CAMPEP_0198723450 /NCGR_PEP_ID=MMETSP1475-20131203/952_1 /TAXON_ID= ORGANISM="Unidentified sp., Strain CCMP1999" /NCGR_SAMPLE_ID=MMETSP1475 /ASSEMBLY_ACC=CAM_ASM_001111 /LENGTH=105 /DNA_ID=CAMNT_0044484571 /DNA_START=742 /DNA_END=1060 /DNA_ORIENTATION=+